MPEAPSERRSTVQQTELMETAPDADAIAASSTQQVLDAIAQAVTREASAGSSALAPIEGVRPETVGSSTASVDYYCWDADGTVEQNATAAGACP